ncbi:MAG: RNA polymerase sigma factor [Myxococcaceae bacterium]|nr:RNA polymerase sigma factor [Myxococcaceae bacterium]
MRLEHLFAAHSQAAWRVLRRCGLDASAADDGLQQVFLVARERLGDIVPGRERAFVCSVAVKVAARLREKARREEPHAEPFEGSTPGVDELYEQKRRRELLDGVLRGLDESLRTVLVLAEIEGLSKREVAEELDIPEGTAASRLRRAKHAFRARLEPVFRE